MKKKARSRYLENKSGRRLVAPSKIREDSSFYLETVQYISKWLRAEKARYKNSIYQNFLSSFQLISFNMRDIKNHKRLLIINSDMLTKVKTVVTLNLEKISLDVLLF
jgi:hypothetical protein